MRVRPSRKMQPPIYNSIGKNYNTTRQADPYLVERIYHLLQAQKDKVYLDIGCGTGNYTIKLSEKGIHIIGVDPSEIMLDTAKLKSTTIEWRFGTAEEIPFANETFDGAVATLTMHHWKDIEKGFSELNRVLKLNGKLVIFTSTPEQMDGYWLNHYFPEMMIKSTQQMPTLEKIKSTAEIAGLEILGTENYFVKEDLKDLFLHAGKYNPEFYFNESNRKGISSFAAISNAEEVNAGLKKLRRDIESGEIKNIQMQYENLFGDYLFIVLKKTSQAG